MINVLCNIIFRENNYILIWERIFVVKDNIIFNRYYGTAMSYLN